MLSSLLQFRSKIPEGSTNQYAGLDGFLEFGYPLLGLYYVCLSIVVVVDWVNLARP